MQLTSQRGQVRVITPHPAQKTPFTPRPFLVAGGEMAKPGVGDPGRDIWVVVCEGGSGACPSLVRMWVCPHCTCR